MSNSKTLTLALIFLIAFMPLAAILMPYAQGQEGYWYRIAVYADSTSGTVTITYNGVAHGPGVYGIPDGTPAVITAAANEGYVFDYFSFTSAGSTGTTTVNPITTTILSAFTVIAHFKVAQTTTYNVFLAAENAGEVSNNYAAITFNGVTQTVAETEETLWFRMGAGVSYTINAVPAVGYEFLSWTINGVNYTDTSITLVNTVMRDITANFDALETPDATQQDLFVNIYTDSEIVRGNSVGVTRNDVTTYVNEGSSSWYRFVENDSITLTAYPDVASTFLAFEYNGANITDTTLSFSMNASFITVKAYFSYDVETAHYILSVSNVNNALATTDNLVLIEYDADKYAEVTDLVGFWARIYNTTGIDVKLTAVPQEGYIFSYFVVNGTIIPSNPTTFYMDGTVAVVAYFSVSGTTPGMPTVTPTPTTTAIPSIFAGLDVASFFTNITLLLQLVVGGILTFVGVLLLVRQAKAWVAGLILLLAGFALTLITQPNYWALVIWGAECITFAAVLYAMKGK
jgi:hypothetical protein